MLYEKLKIGTGFFFAELQGQYTGGLGFGVVFLCVKQVGPGHVTPPALIIKRNTLVSPLMQMIQVLLII